MANKDLLHGTGWPISEQNLKGSGYIRVWLIHFAASVELHSIVSQLCSESPTYESESCRCAVKCLIPENQFPWLACIVPCVHTLRGFVLLCTFMTLRSAEGQCLYFKPRVSGSTHKSSSDVAGTIVHVNILYCKTRNVFFIFCACFLCLIGVKSIINLS